MVVSETCPALFTVLLVTDAAWEGEGQLGRKLRKRGIRTYLQAACSGMLHGL